MFRIDYIWLFNLLIHAGKKIKKKEKIKKEYNKIKTLVLLALWCPHYEYVGVIYTHTQAHVDKQFANKQIRFD